MASCHRAGNRNKRVARTNSLGLEGKVYPFSLSHKIDFYSELLCRSSNMDSSRIAGLLFFIASSEFVVFLVVSEALYHGYSVAANYISDLGVGPSSVIFNVSIIALGFLVLLGSYYLHRAFHDGLLTAFLVLTGIGAVGVGVLTENFGLIHGVMSLITFLFGGLSAVWSYRTVRFPFSVLAVILGLGSLLALLLFGTRVYLGLGVGGMERMIAYPILMWGAAFGGYLMASSPLLIEQKKTR